MSAVTFLVSCLRVFVCVCCVYCVLKQIIVVCFIGSVVILHEITLVKIAVILYRYCLQKTVFRSWHLKYMYPQDAHHSKSLTLLYPFSDGKTRVTAAQITSEVKVVHQSSLRKWMNKKTNFLSNVRLTLISLCTQWEQIVLEYLQLFSNRTSSVFDN